ncbi:FISUMP domain-containing protein [Bacteroidota bacterium]
MKTLLLITRIFTITFLFCIFSLNTSAQFTCGNNLTDVRDGRVYSTVQVGSQCWIAENMNYGSMIPSSTSGSIMTDNAIVEKYCWNNDSTWCNGTGGHDKYGAFYEWQEALQYYGGQPTLPIQGICPEGWHIPSKSEFDAMITYLGGTSVAGGKMKVGGSSGFEGLLTGYRCTMNGSFLNSPTGSNKIAYYWSSEMSDGTNSYFYELNSTNSFGNGQYSPFYKSLGLSVRCLKDGGSAEIGEYQFKPRLIIEGYNYENNQININYYTSHSDYVTFTLYDITGKKVYLEIQNTNTGTNTIKIPLDNQVQKGIYIISLSNKLMHVTDKVTIL